MKPFDWSEEKNTWLKVNRGIGFENVVGAVHENGVLDVLQHHNPRKYPNQKVYIITIDSYVYAVPYIETETVIFLKTIYPSRKYTKQYLGRKE